MPEDAGSRSPTLLDVMRQRAERYRDKVAFDYCHYSPGGEEHSRLTYRELDIKARAIASTLQRLGATGERVLVLCPSGLDCIASFFGCIYAGAVAVPVHPPVRKPGNGPRRVDCRGCASRLRPHHRQVAG